MGDTGNAVECQIANYAERDAEGSEPEHAVQLLHKSFCKAARQEEGIELAAQWACVQSTLLSSASGRPYCGSSLGSFLEHSYSCILLSFARRIRQARHQPAARLTVDKKTTPDSVMCQKSITSANQSRSLKQSMITRLLKAQQTHSNAKQQEPRYSAFFVTKSYWHRGHQPISTLH